MRPMTGPYGFLSDYPVDDEESDIIEPNDPVYTWRDLIKTRDPIEILREEVKKHLPKEQRNAALQLIRRHSDAIRKRLMRIKTTKDGTDFQEDFRAEIITRMRRQRIRRKLRICFRKSNRVLRFYTHLR